MRRRLTAVIVAVVTGALAVAGFGSLWLVGRATVNQTRQRLDSQAAIIADNLDTFVAGRTVSGSKSVLGLVTEVSRLEGAAIVAVQPSGNLTPIQPSAPLLGLLGASRPLPSGLSSAQLHPPALLAGQTVSGRRGSLIWVAVPGSLDAAVLVPANTATARQAARAAALRRELSVLAPNGSVPIAVVVTDRVSGAPGATYYFLFSGLAALAVAAAVASAMGRRIARPLAAVEATARRIADGDLSSRVSVGPGEYRELASLAGSINSMTESLERSRGMERQFLLSVSHDLRTPLTSIRGWAEAIADGAAGDDRRAAGVIGSEARRLERLVQDLLDLAKLEARSFSLVRQPVDVGEVVMDRAEGLRPAIEEAGLRLEVSVPEAPLAVRADPDRLAQVVANLVENAFKFARTTVTVSAAGHDDRVAVTVADDGPGIASEDAPHVFERFYTASRSPARQAGSGLGLAIVKELVEAMSGQVAVGPADASGGTRVSVILPAEAG
ncbi:MAG TPA: HAMP domain-containing sensor histidine kinase [Acidimicrobiales bacterium]|nr:HAMP domain-containing sensor histidine kinase [Acidimicrobiales bacterium]